MVILNQNIQSVPIDVSDKSHFFFSFEIKDWDYGAMTQTKQKIELGS